ncbi:alpha/beta fold hydrolase [Paludibaculum fermentans]|uniref:Alpha/beta fold hydrolase n=1 Tax=Paludibaculum fermentans TaxID=1473598 RepID=A0A7S7NUQ9_PALFE|nr:alpha/beta fold hydrolase [Paludibaculum fermentans]QOY90168.1 alpha/beta fold hydrolase [Paludibaculum fermentans]
MSATAGRGLGAKPQPVLIETALGVAECAVWGEGPVVLALHGAMGGYDQSAMLARAALAGVGFQVVAVSRPGYLGTPLGEAAAPEQQADLCAALLDALGLRHAAVLAISGGGQCALQFALRHGRRCRGLVLVSACTAQLRVKLPLRFHLLKWMARLPWLTARLREKAAQRPEESARRAILDPELCRRTLADPVAGPLLTELQLSTMEHLAQRLPGTQNDIVQSRRPFEYPVEQIGQPVLLVHGTADEVVPFADSRSLAGRLPRAELLALEGGAHVSLFTHLHEIRARVGPFLEGHGPG